MGPIAAAASATVAVAVVRALLLFLTATFAFDCIHFTLHHFLQSRRP